MYFFIAILAALAVSATTYAQGINYPVANPTGTSGTGNARTDPDNLFIRNNVAGMTEIPHHHEEEANGNLNTKKKGGWRFLAELQVSSYKYRRERLEGPLQGVVSRADLVPPGAAFEMTYTSMNHKYSFGVGSYTIFGFQSKLKDPVDTMGDRALFFDTRIASNDLAFGGSVRLHKKLSVGGSFIIGRGFLDLKQPTPAVAVLLGTISQSRLDVSAIGAPGASVGFHFRPTDRLGLAINYKTKRRYNFDGHLDSFDIGLNEEGLLKAIPIRPEVSVKFKLPAVVESGLEVRATRKLLLAADFRFYDYTAAFQTVNVVIKETGQVRDAVKLDARDVRSFRTGGIYSVTDSTKLHFGWAYTTNGFPESTINPGLVNVGGMDVSGGIGKRLFGRWINVGVAGIFGRTRTVDPVSNPLFAGKYSGNGFMIGIGFRSSK
jgi:long-subunit fatty acid transport protein